MRLIFASIFLENSKTYVNIEVFIIFRKSFYPKKSNIINRKKVMRFQKYFTLLFWKFHKLCKHLSFQDENFYSKKTKHRLTDGKKTFKKKNALKVLAANLF